MPTVFDDDAPVPTPTAPALRSGRGFLAWLAGQQWRTLALGSLFGVLWMGAQALVPGALGRGVQAAVDADPPAAARWGAVVLALGVVQAVAGILRHRLAVLNWLTAGSRVHRLVARQAAALGADLRGQVATGEVVAVSAHDVERVGDAFDVLARFIGALVAASIVTVALLRIAPTLGLVVVIGLPLLSLAVAPLVRPLERRESVQRERVGHATELASDTVAGLRVLRGIGGEQLFLDRFVAASQAARHAGVATARVRSVLEGLQVALPGILVAVVVALGVREVQAGHLSVGSLVAFYGYTAFLVLPLRTLTEAAEKFTAAGVAARRVVRVLGLQRVRPEPAVPAQVPDAGTQPLVDDATGLIVPPGTVLGVAADRPEDADALTDRLGGYGASPGTVFGAGPNGHVPLDDLATPTLRERVLVQDKDPVILSGTVRELLAVPGSGRVDLHQAVAAAHAQDVVEGLGGLDAALPERGRSLSGGQRQRLALARSLVADPDVLVLAEPTSAVDAHTEARIASSLVGLRAGRTTVVLSTSPLVLHEVDQVALLESGRVVAVGTHAELLHRDAYRRLVIRESP